MSSRSSSSSTTTVTESVVSLREKIPPFQFLPTAELRALARTMTLEYFPKDTVILAAGRQVSEALYIDALEDAFVTAQLWQKLLAKLQTMKVGTLGEVLRVGRA